MSAITCGLQDPRGTIQKFGTHAGSTGEVTLISPVQVAANDQHHLIDLKAAVKKGAEGTIFRLYISADGSTYTHVDSVEIGDYGTYTSTYGVSLKVPAGYYWKVTGQQDTAARMAIKVGGVAKVFDVRD